MLEHDTFLDTDRQTTSSYRGAGGENARWWDYDSPVSASMDLQKEVRDQSPVSSLPCWHPF